MSLNLCRWNSDWRIFRNCETFALLKTTPKIIGLPGWNGLRAHSPWKSVTSFPFPGTERTTNLIHVSCLNPQRKNQLRWVDPGTSWEWAIIEKYNENLAAPWDFQHWTVPCGSLHVFAYTSATKRTNWSPFPVWMCVIWIPRSGHVWRVVLPSITHAVSGRVQWHFTFHHIYRFYPLFSPGNFCREMTRDFFFLTKVYKQIKKKRKKKGRKKGDLESTIYLNKRKLKTVRLSGTNSAYMLYMFTFYHCDDVCFSSLVQKKKKKKKSGIFL